MERTTTENSKPGEVGSLDNLEARLQKSRPCWTHTDSGDVCMCTAFVLVVLAGLVFFALSYVRWPSMH